MWVLAIILALVVLVVAVYFFHRYYVKSTRDAALVRTGVGGRKVVIDGGTLALPIFHRVDRVNMRSMRLRAARKGADALISSDRQRVDLVLEFNLRVEPTEEGIATAAQTLGSKAFREDEMQSLMEGNLIDAVQSEVALRSMDSLHDDRSALCEAISTRLSAKVERSGLRVESVSLVHLDQTPFSALDDNNAFNALGMRRLAEVISTNRKARIDIEAETDIAIRQRQFEQTRERLAIEQAQEQAELEKRLRVEQQRIESDTEIETLRTRSSRMTEEARIARDREIKQIEIDRDLQLRKHETEALAELEVRKLENAIQIAVKRGEETLQQAKTEAARAKVIEAQEQVQTSKDVAAAERARKLAGLKAAQDAETDDTKIKTQVSSIISLARAEAEATGVKGSAERERLVSEADGRKAQIEAENTQSEAVLRARLETHRLDRLPEIMTQMMKPVEKIDSIRINQIAGLGQNAGDGGGNASPFNQALDSILGMSVQLPLMKKIGDEIGLDFDAQLAGRTADAAGRAAGASRAKKDT